MSAPQAPGDGPAPPAALPLREIEATPDGGIRCRVIFDQGSSWFAGHFPGQPVLPGVALLAVAEALALEQASRAGRALAVEGVARVRFKRLVRAGEDLCFEVAALPVATPGGIIFRANASGEPVCHGTLLLRDTCRASAGG